MLYLGLGQSLLALTPRQRPLGQAPKPVDPVRAWVLSASGTPRVADDPTQDLPGDALGETAPHLRDGRSGPLTAASAEILAALGAADRLLTVNLARRNTEIAAFLPGGAAFRNLERCLAHGVALAAARGLRFERLVVSWVQGQADARTPHSLYVDRLGALIDGIEAALAAVTGGGGSLLFCLSQTTAFYRAGRRGAALAQAEVAATRPGQVVMAGPEYMLERWDGVHLKPRGAVRLGVLHGRAIRRALLGEAWEPLRMVEAEVRGAEVRVRFAGGIGDLEHSVQGEGPVEVGVRPLEHFGFAWNPPRGVTTRITAAQISGAREVTLTLSEAPPHLEKTLLTLGFPHGIGLPEGFSGGDPALAGGGATGLRTGGGGPDPFAGTLHDWALQQRIVPRWSETA